MLNPIVVPSLISRIPALGTQRLACGKMLSKHFLCIATEGWDWEGGHFYYKFL